VKLLLKNKNNFFAKNHCEIQLCTILVCALYPIKYGTYFQLTELPNYNKLFESIEIEILKHSLTCNESLNICQKICGQSVNPLTKTIE
jgi:hypothetical protein